MSDYFKSLKEPDQLRYREKLCIAGVQHEDPYERYLNDWTSEPRRMPPMTIASIVVYLIFSPSQFTADTVQAYKSLEAYNYFTSGFVKECKMREPPGSGVCFVKASVTPSQRVTGESHKAWVCLDSVTGQVRAGHCTCKAGLTEVCSHVAAVLFTVECTSNRLAEGTSCTSLPCAWSSKVNKKSSMVPIDELDLSKPGKSRKTIPKQNNYTSEPYKPADEEIFRRLREINPGAVVLKSIPKLDGEDTDSASEDEECYTFLRNAAKSGSSRDTLIHDLFVPLTEIERIEKSTRQQSSSHIWKEARYGRLTASVMHRVKVKKFITSPKHLLDTILQRVPPVNTKQMQWGKDNEKVARNAYKSSMETCHENFKLHDIGFVIDTKNPFIGATPDGLWSCNCHGVGLLEIKCPWTLRDGQTDTAVTRFLDENQRIIPTHEYYTQVQTQLHVCQKEVAHFVVWSPAAGTVMDASTQPNFANREHRIVINVIKYDKSFMTDIIAKAKHFWSTYVVPELL